MAFDFFAGDQDEEQQQQGVVGAGQTLGQESPIVTGNQPQPQGEGGKGTSSGSFTNLQDYLDRNKSLQFGQQVAGKVQGTVDEANRAQKDTDTSFRSKVDQGAVDRDDAVIGRVQSDPTGLAGDQSARQQWERMRDARYQGPNSLADDDENYLRAYRATDRAKETADQTRSEGGRKAYLQQQYGSGAGRYDYTRGQQKLDNLLIQNDPGSREAFQRVQQNAQQAGQGFDSLRSTLEGYASQRAGDTAATRAAARGAVGIDDAGNLAQSGALPGQIGSLDQRVAQRRQELAAERAKFAPIAGKDYLSEVDPKILQMAGLDPAAFGGVSLQSLYHDIAPESYVQGIDVDPGYFFGVDPGGEAFNQWVPETDINRGSVSNTEELARLKALSDLAGVDQTFIPNEIDVGKYDEESLGRYAGDFFRDTVGQKRGAYEAEMRNELDRLRSAANPGTQPGGAQDSGILDTGAIQAAVNAIRQKYGLPAVGV